MYYIGIGNDRINETKINPSSQWKQYDVGPIISLFLQINTSPKSCKMIYIVNIMKSSSNNMLPILLICIIIFLTI